jgi:tRNA(Ile)-lysidine synthase
VDSIHARVSAFLRSHGIGREVSVLVAASAGPDSTALLRIVAALGQRSGAAHVHHGLRGPDADRDLEFVRRTACELGVPFFAEFVDALRRDSRSPEARARELRYAALERIRARRGFDVVATGHTIDDQAETVLLRAIRGASPAGLAGIAQTQAGGKVIRPLLSVRRAEIRAYLAERGFSWREDASNADLRVPRNRIRHEVLDRLEAAHPGAVRALARLADDAAHLGRWLETEAERALAGLRRTREGSLVLERKALLELPGPARVQAIATLLARAGLGDHVTRDQLRRLEGLILRPGVRGRVSLPRGKLLVREGEQLWLGAARVHGISPKSPVQLVPPQSMELPERGVRFEWHRVEPSEHRVIRPDVLRLPEKIGDRLYVRAAAPGDQMRLVGESKARPLKELFRQARWPWWDRRSALVVTWREQVVWVVGLAGADLPAPNSAPAWELRAVWLSGTGGNC